MEIEAHGDELIVRSATKARSGWEEAFREMARQGDDALLDRDALPPTRWDRTD